MITKVIARLTDDKPSLRTIQLAKSLMRERRGVSVLCHGLVRGTKSPILHAWRSTIEERCSCSYSFARRCSTRIKVASPTSNLRTSWVPRLTKGRVLPCDRFGIAKPRITHSRTNVATCGRNVYGHSRLYDPDRPLSVERCDTRPIFKPGLLLLIAAAAAF